MIGLFIHDFINKNALENLELQKFAQAATCFYLKYKQNETDNNYYYWRLVGEYNQDLLSLTIKKGLIYSIELLGFNYTQVVRYSSPYTVTGNIKKYTPNLSLLPCHKENKVIINDIYIDNWINFSVFSYEDAFKICWREKASITVFLSDCLALELSEDNELTNIVIFENLDDTFKQSDLTLTLYPGL